MFDSISYVIPVFNEEQNIDNIVHKIEEAFNNNNLNNYEILFIDDGSSDSTVSIIKKYISKRYPIKCICLTRNLGIKRH